MIIQPEKIKPDFENVRKVWEGLLSAYFTPEGQLKESCGEEVSCPHCFSQKRSQEFFLNGFKHGTCNTCRSVYVSPRLREEHLKNLYADNYYSEVYGKSMLPAFEARKEVIGQRKYRQVTQFHPKVGKVLDIGCGVGEVLDVFKDNSWDTQGIEVNPVAVDWLKRRGHRIFSGTLEEFPDQGPFDVIMAWGVIEHVASPHLFLDKVYRLLRPGGHFVSEVPHAHCLLVDYCRKTGKDPGRILQGEQHVILYSQEAYTQIHQSAGLEKVHLQTNGLDLQTLVNIQGGTLAPQIMGDIQECLDKNFYGDLLRGFWVK